MALTVLNIDSPVTAIKAHVARHAAKHGDKVIKVAHKSRVWCEIVSCGAVAYETHIILLTVASVAWIIVDVILVVIGGGEI